ncbi:EamA family transporter [Oculatella sp. LEGE 06141]|uniref:EamA family transporter n=1 Tax=Oculatella sp. LEGE 06141 TaxID=1828648 RepID=UPI00188178A6|nr:EamA family transporter [Oculatella sp. LEGE 06141]MBE9181825.1 EamA family transporter [Oculatella sp. LEGE 06141]
MTAEQALKTVAQDLQNLQHDLVAQLNQDVRRLQVEKSLLVNDIERLREQRKQLQTQNQVVLSQQQLLQQQAWAKQLAYVLANHLQAALVQRLHQAAGLDTIPGEASSSLTTGVNAHHENAHKLLSSLDDTLTRTFTALRQDLNSYEGSIAQQINRMHNLEQQGEAILEMLVNRLSQHLRVEAARTQAASSAMGNGNGHGISDHPVSLPRTDSMPLRQGPPTVLPVAPVSAPEPPVAPVRSPLRYGFSQFKIGFALILLSTVALSLHNVAVGVIGNPSNVLGLFQVGGFIKLNSVGNSLWILLMRMWVVVPAMASLAWFLYKPTWHDIKKFSLSNDRALLRSVVGSGFFLFLSQVLIYIAIGQIGPGVAVTILFMYPIVTVPLAWLLFGDRPSQLRVVVMVAISLGVVLTALPKLAATTNISWIGIGAAIISGISFACYLISMQISFRKLHPVPVSLIQFVTIFVLTHLMLLFFQVGEPPANGFGLFLSGIVLGVLTLAGYLLNNFGVRFMGAARASIIASSGPVLTALLAFVITPGDRTELKLVQWLGIFIVTSGVVALSFERMVSQGKAAKQVQMQAKDAKG